MTRRTQHKPAERGRTGAAALLLVLLFCIACTAPALAGTISVDTSGLTGKTTDTILVPVTVTDPGTIVAWQLSAKTGDLDNAKIVFNTESVRKSGATSGEEVIYWFEASNPDNYIRSEKTLFYFAVTPKTEGQIPIEIYDVRVYEAVNGVREGVNYTVRNGTLTVSGTGSGITTGDSASGATVRYGITDASGVYAPGDATGVTRVSVPGYPETPVTIFTGSPGIYPVPETLKYFSGNEVYTESPAGDEYSLTLAVAEADLTNAGITPDALFVLHAINGTWYEANIIAQPATADGIITLTIKTWSPGAFLLGYDKGGATYAKETRNIALGITSPDIPWTLIGAAAIILIVLLAVAAVLSKRKHKTSS